MVLADAIARIAGRIARHLGRLVGSKDNCCAALAAVEFALIAPLLATAILCTVDLGLGVYRKMQVQNAAQAGAEYALTHGFLASAVTTATTSATSYSGIQATPAPAQFCGCPSSTGVTSAGCGTNCTGGAQAGTYVTVSAQAVYTTLLPYPLLPSSYTLTAQSTVRTQ